jgi:hypothetical protein
MAEINQSIASRWTPKLISGGWTPVSTYFIDNYHRLIPKISSLEAMLIIQLVRHKWDERNPHPTFTTIANRMGISATAARNHARSLEKKGYLRRIMTQGTSNQFDMKSLFLALERLLAADKAAKAPINKETAVVDPAMASMLGEGGMMPGGSD